MESSDSASDSSPRRDRRNKLRDSDDERSTLARTLSDAESSANEDGEDDILFKFAKRSAFKRKVENSDEEDSENDENGTGGDSESDSGGDESEFNSSPERDRKRGYVYGCFGGDGAGSRPTDTHTETDEDASPMPARKKRQVLDEAALKAKADANIEDCLLDDTCDVVAPMSSKLKADRDYSRKMRSQLAAASTIDVPGRGYRHGLGRGGVGATHETALAAATAAVREAEEARSRRALGRKLVKLRVIRDNKRAHTFVTKLEKEVGVVLEGCRVQPKLLSGDEEDAEISLYYRDTLLDSEKTFQDAGITDDATLRLEVDGEAPTFSGPPIAVKVRTQGGKVFTVEITMDTTFAAFMEGFNAAVGIPPERAHESIFKFDGDNLNPNGTPEGEDMEPEDMVDAQLPADLMVAVQASPSQLKLNARPKKKQPATGRAKGKGKGGAASRSTTAAAAAAAAVPLGRSRTARSNQRSSGRVSGSSSRGSFRGSAGQEPELVVLD